MNAPLDSRDVEALFEQARTHNAWTDRPVSDQLLVELYNRLRWAPTSLNSNPARFVFVRSGEAKARLRPHLSPTNAGKMMAAPVCAIVAVDLRFFERMPELFPARDMSAMFDNSALVEDTATRNAVLQGGYLILAARSLGLDCGPMSGFDRTGVDQAFFADGRCRANFLVNLGYGDPEALWPRNPRLSFADACEIR